MRNLSKKNLTGSSPLGRFFSSFQGLKTSERSLVKAPRRRDIERLEERQMLSVNYADDPLFQDQWHLQATGQLVEQPTSPTFLQSMAAQDINVLGAWDLGYTGAGVQVAVVDTGFDLTHPDLTYILDLTDFSGDPNTLPFLDLVDLDNDPAYIDTTTSHGTAVAGIIGARDNTVGGLGIAPGVDIIPIRFLPGDSDVTNGVQTNAQLAIREYLQFAGVPAPGDDGLNTDQIVDIYNRSYGISAGRQAIPMDPDRLEALRTAATLGRGSWLDQDGDGVYEVEEIEALGSINVTSAGNNGGPGFSDPFTSIGIYDSSQYNQYKNSRYTIAVGSVDFGGNYKNPETGSRGSWAETGANVLIVAPTATIRLGIGTDYSLVGGITTTDSQGDDGGNQAPIFGQEIDNDYLPDTDYMSGFNGTSAAAPEVSGVIALMLEANPKLSYRDVEQILLMSAAQNDIFDETWIVNAYEYFEDAYTIPQFSYDGIDVDGDGSNELDQSIISNYGRVDPEVFLDPTLGPDQWAGVANLASYVDEEGITRYYVPDSLTTFFENIVLNGTNNDVTDIVAAAGIDPDEFLYIFPNDNPLSEFTGLNGLLSPISGQNKGISDNTTSTSGFLEPLVNNELLFENGAGFTVSWGYGDYLEEYGYAHGSLDAELAVRLAENWEIYDLYLEDEVTITSSIQNDLLRVQPKMELTIGNGPAQFEVPGGISNGAINEAYYSEFLAPVLYGNLNFDGNDFGSTIIAAPFFDTPIQDPWETGSGRGDSRIAIPIDTNITTDFLSLEWVEFTTQLTLGDIDSLRVSLVSPDGTQSELSPYRTPVDGGAEIYQEPQSQQGPQTPGDEVLDETFGLTNIVNSEFLVGDIDFTTAFIDGQEDIEVTSIDLPDPLAPGESWTWTTNRHWGELFSTEAQNVDVAGAPVDGQWYIVMENWSNLPVEFSNQYEVALHGVEATGNRIQGKIGVDDNAQGREAQDNDEVFNFERNMTFGQVGISTPDFAGVVQVVLDDATDSVHYNNNYYETVDDSTGEVFRYAVVDELEYTALAEITKGAIGSDVDKLEQLAIATGQYLSAYSAAEVQEWYQVYGSKLGFDPNPVAEVDGMGAPLLNPSTGEAILSEQDLDVWRAQLLDMVVEDIVAAETFEAQLNYGAAVGDTELTPSVDSSGFVMTYQNFDFNQESFASNVIVQATQYVVNYDAAGNALPRAATGVVDYFNTGADGNYWFDVEATPEPPNPANYVNTAAYEAAYDQWFGDFGKVFEYEVSLVGNSAFQDRVIDKDYSSEVNMLREASGANSADILYGSGSIDYQMGDLKYNVPIFASPDLHNGQTTVLKDVNFLLEVDPAKTNVNVTGSVYRDQDGDNIFDSSEAGAAGAVVYHDADGSGTLDAGEASGVVDADGNYAFTVSGITSQQAITIAVDGATIPASLEFLNPLTGAQSIDVTPGFGIDVDFTLQLIGGEPALVQGIVYEDVNQNATFDNTEFGLGSANQVTVYIDLNNDGVYDIGTEPSAVTLPDGTFAIESDIAGNYNVRVDLSSTPLTLSAPVNNAINVDVVVGQAISDLEFGMYDSRTQDYGDLQGYPTLLSENGARHVVMPGVHLGSRVDIDDDGMPTADARGDDFTNLSDEDGVVILGDIAPDTDFDLEITAFGQGASLNAWIDFNNDGDWDDLGEQIFVDVGLVLGQKNTLTVTAPSDVDLTASALAARFRWGPFGLTYDGPANAGEVEDYMLPTATPVNISGTVRNDIDGDGVFDPTDTPVENVVVYYDANLDGIRQASELSSVTNAAGEYQIAISTAVPLAVTLRIDEDSLVNNEEFVAPIDGIFSQIVDPGVPETANFLVGFPQGIQGNVFADNDNNGLKGGTETGFAGITVNLLADNNNDGSFETIVGTAVTDAAGDYNIPVSVADTYELRIDLSGLEFHTQSTPATVGQEVTIAAGVVGTAADFGVYNAALDFTADYGDLLGPNFPTTEAESGASHTVVAGFFLGSGVDADPGTLTSANATADDNSLTDDEDGIVLVSNQILADSTVEIDVTATGAGGVMNAWIDFNNDGDWDDLGEQVLIDRALTSGATTRVVIDTTGIEVSGTASTLAARFRWGSIGLGYGGADTLGEVEDYYLPTVQIDPTGVTGDYDGNGFVDANDRLTWVANYGSTTNLDADGNDDGKVDAADYTIWRDAYEAALLAPAFALSSEEEDSSQEEAIYVSPATYATVASSSAASEVEVEIPQLVQHPIVEEVVVVETVEIVASVSQSLNLEAAVLFDSTQDESFAVDSEEESDVSLADDSIDAALLDWDDASLASDSNDELEFSLLDEEEEEEALDEVLSEAFSAI